VLERTTNVTLPEKIEEVLKLEELATPSPWEIVPDCAGGKDEAWCYWHRIGKLELPGKHPNNDGVFIAAARNITRPLAKAYTAVLTALEASDSDRQKLAARVAELEAVCQTIGKQSTEYATKVGYAEGRAMGLEYRVKQLEAELAKSKTDRDWFQSMLARNASTQA
jgi:hypothetical protein